MSEQGDRLTPSPARAPRLRGGQFQAGFDGLRSQRLLVTVQGCALSSCPQAPSSACSCLQVKLERLLCEQDRVLQDLEDKMRALKENKVCISFVNLGLGGGL